MKRIVRLSIIILIIILPLIPIIDLSWTFYRDRDKVHERSYLLPELGLYVKQITPGRSRYSYMVVSRDSSTILSRESDFARTWRGNDALTWYIFEEFPDTLYYGTWWKTCPTNEVRFHFSQSKDSIIDAIDRRDSCALKLKCYAFSTDATSLPDSDLRFWSTSDSLKTKRIKPRYREYPLSADLDSFLKEIEYPY